MSNDTTRPGVLDSSGHTYKRRMSDERLQVIADSALLKVIQYAITGIAIPLVIWGANTILERLGSIEKSLQKSDTISATYELRLLNIERATQESKVQTQFLTNQVLGHEYEIKALSKPK